MTAKSSFVILRKIEIGIKRADRLPDRALPLPTFAGAKLGCSLSSRTTKKVLTDLFVFGLGADEIQNGLMAVEKCAVLWPQKIAATAEKIYRSQRVGSQKQA